MCQALKLYFLDSSRQSYNTDDRKIEKRLWGQRSHAWSSTAGSPSKPLSPGQLPLYSRGIPGKAQNHLGPGSLICRKRVIGTPVTWGFWVASVRQKVLYFVVLGDECAPESPLFCTSSGWRGGMIQWKEQGCRINQETPRPHASKETVIA